MRNTCCIGLKLTTDSRSLDSWHTDKQQRDTNLLQLPPILLLIGSRQEWTLESSLPCLLSCELLPGTSGTDPRADPAQARNAGVAFRRTHSLLPPPGLILGAFRIRVVVVQDLPVAGSHHWPLLSYPAWISAPRLFKPASPP